MDYCDCFYQLFGLSFWRHPFTAEDLLDLHEVSCLNVRIGSHDVPGALMSVCRLFFCPHPSDNDSQTRLHPKPKLQSCFSAGEHMKTGIYVSLTDVERQRRKNTQNISKNVYIKYIKKWCYDAWKLCQYIVRRYQSSSSASHLSLHLYFFVWLMYISGVYGCISFSDLTTMESFQVRWSTSIRVYIIDILFLLYI